MMTLLQTTDRRIQPLRKISDDFLYPLLDLGLRLWMANIFFKSGLLKLGDIMSGNFERVVTAFTDFHPIPGMPGEVAAVLGTGGELVFPVLLGLGLFTRLGAAGLFFMTITIQYIVPAEYDLGNPDHYFWMLLLAVPLLNGPSKLSTDYWLVKYLRKDQA